MIEWIEMVEHNHPLSFRGNEELMKIPFTYALEEYRDSLPGGEKEFYRGSSLPPDDLIIYSYEKEKDGMRFVTVTPEQVWGEKTAKELRGKQI